MKQTYKHIAYITENEYNTVLSRYLIISLKLWSQWEKVRVR